MRGEKEDRTRAAIEWRQTAGKKPRRRPRKRWVDEIIENPKKMGNIIREERIRDNRWKEVAVFSSKALEDLLRLREIENNVRPGTFSSIPNRMRNQKKSAFNSE